MIYSTRRRYVVVTIFFTSVFWLTVELILLSYTNRLNVELPQSKNELPEAWIPREGNQNSAIADVLLPIEDFRTLYVTSIPPNPGGPGEGGKAVYNDKDDPSEVSKEKEGYTKYSFNELASTKISLERSIPDNRPQEWVYIMNQAVNVKKRSLESYILILACRGIIGSLLLFEVLTRSCS